MPHDNSWQRQQRARWMRHDAHLWIRPDAARFLPLGMDPAEVYPALARKPDAAKTAAAAAFAAEIEEERRLLDAMREELASIKAELARRRSMERKYSPSQPRVPAGNHDGGQWTDRGGGSAGSSGFGSGDGSQEGSGSDHLAAKPETSMIPI